MGFRLEIFPNKPIHWYPLTHENGVFSWRDSPTHQALSGTIRTKATIAQSDLVGFTTLASSREPMEARESLVIYIRSKQIGLVKLLCCYMLLLFFLVCTLWSILIEGSQNKFRSQTSDNMDGWKAEVEQKNRREEQKREDQRRERVRRKKMQVREKVGKSRNTVFFQWFVAPEGRKVGSLKRRVQSQLARWEMKNCTPLWREAHFQVKTHKAPQLRTAFGSWDVETMLAVVARSTFRNQKWSPGFYNGYLNPILIYWYKHGTCAWDHAVVAKTEGHFDRSLMHHLPDVCRKAFKKLRNLVLSHDSPWGPQIEYAYCLSGGKHGNFAAGWPSSL